ncbi:Diacylglycerol kinase 4 [Vitis vinifera]|uniref:Diacylglycerol kinase 4 n=1 Tax=Vitis vinifera TaxID=29760 RepID=A0A438CPG4_VITVI|nr:Diacylglycerol kinase 4 [Vitis vinifera]
MIFIRQVVLREDFEDPDWHVLISMPPGVIVDPPHSLKPTEECALDQGLDVESQLPEKVTCYEGVFYNYFSIGMDAQVAYGFHHLRNERPYLAQGPISNKKKSHLVSWSMVQLDKTNGGLGIRSLRTLNKAHLSIWGMAFKSDEGGLWGGVVEGSQKRVRDL